MTEAKEKKQIPRGPALAACAEFRPKGREQWGLFLIGLAVACYIAFVILTKAFLLMPNTSGWLVYLLFPVLAPAIYWFMCFLLHRFPDRPLRKLTPTVDSIRGKLSPAVFFGAFFAVFAVLGLGLLANYPGGFGITDLGWQWEQVQTGKFDSWHPPIHTMLIWLVTRIVNSHGFFIAVQILFFSLLCGYMAATLRAWGLQRLWVALLVLALVSTHSTRAAMLYTFKDCLFTCFVLWAMICVINIVLSHGKWLGRWGNRAAFAVALAFSSTIRINGFLFTIPLAALVCVFYAKKQTVGCVFSGALALLMIAGVQGPLYKAVGVTVFENKTYMELSNIPMKIIASIYLVNPGALDEDGKRMMQFLATPEQWAGFHDCFGNFYEIRGLMMPPLPQVRETMDQILGDYNAVCSPLKKLASMFWHAVKNEPVLAIAAAAVSCNLVWDPTLTRQTIGIYPDGLQMILRNDDAINSYFDNHLTGVQLRESILAESRKPFFRAFQLFRTPYRVLELIFRTLTPGSLLQCVGLNVIALMLCMWISLRRYRGWAALLLGLPILANTLPFIVMLIGPQEYRLFIPTVVMTIPLILVCLAKIKDPAQGGGHGFDNVLVL